MMRNIKKILFLAAFIIAHVFILRNIFLLSIDMLNGDRSGEKMIPLPRYGFARIPDSPFTEQYKAQNRLAVDFAQIYFPARQMASLSENYQSGILDPLQRPSRYPPLVHYLCSITICKLDYGLASVLHVAIQVFLFYLVFIISFISLKIGKYILPGLLLANIYLFLTPAGLSWFERGQFSLYVGAAILLMILGLMKKNFLAIMLSAMFAFIKWTSFPSLFVIFSAVLVGSKNLAEGKKTLFWGGAFLLVVFALTFAFPAQSIQFLKGLLHQERFAAPGGVSLAKILPVWLEKLLPLPLIILGYFHLKINRGLVERAILFLAGSAVLMLTYPTLAYEYNLPSLLGFIPLLLYWSTLIDNPIKEPMRGILNYSFLAFVLVASFSNIINQGIIIMIEYLVISAFFFVVPLFYFWNDTRGSNRASKAQIQ
ncbi:MAG: hypothetical protein ACXWNC_07280 [Anaerolineales bacterium]